MLAATCLAAGVAWVASRQMASANEANTCLTALAIGSLATFIPVVLRISADFWGLTVLASGLARAMIVLGVCYFLTQAKPGLVERAVFLPAVAAVILLLIVESAAAVKFLSTLDRRKAELKRSGQPA
jgi:hypothetical protein